MKLRYLIAASLALAGCEIHSYPQPAKYKQPQTYQHYDPEPVVHYEPEPVVYYVEEVYICEPPYDPVGIDPAYCTDYGVGTGYCCTYEYGDWDHYCAEEWCWWEDMCYWDQIDTSCYEIY